MRGTNRDQHVSVGNAQRWPNSMSAEVYEDQGFEGVEDFEEALLTFFAANPSLTSIDITAKTKEN